MVDTRIEFLYINLETIPRIFNVFERKFDFSHRSGNASLLDARERIRRKDRDPNRFEDIHNGMVYYSVGIVREPEYQPFFGFVDCKSFILLQSTNPKNG